MDAAAARDREARAPEAQCGGHARRERELGHGREHQRRRLSHRGLGCSACTGRAHGWHGEGVRERSDGGERDRAQHF